MAGRSLDSGSVRTVNPATGEEIARYPVAALDDASRKLKTADLAFRNGWRRSSVEERSDYLRRLASSLLDHKKDAARTMTEEMGKPISQSEAEVEKCAWGAGIFADNLDKWLSSEQVQTDAKESSIEFQPLGVVLSVMPWNFPFWQTCRSIIPALAAGNTVMLRHSNQVPGCSLRFEEIFHDAGFPEGVFGSVVTGHEVVEKLIESPIVRGVSFSGSIDSGKKVGEIAGRNLKKAVMELGGSDPFIVLDDADVGEAARVGANARLVCNGQSCIAAKRFIVLREVANEFVDALSEEFQEKTVGNPMDRGVDVGPLRNEYQVSLLDGQVRDALGKGATSRIGGRPTEGRGFYYDLTILEGVKPEMRVMQEEVFGPVAPIYVAPDEAAAIDIANATEFGLGASVWTDDVGRGKDLSRRLECGVSFVYQLVKSDPRMPFGGV